MSYQVCTSAYSCEPSRIKSAYKITRNINLATYTNTCISVIHIPTKACTYIHVYMSMI